MPEPTTEQSIKNKLLSSKNPIWEKTKQLGQQEIEKAKQSEERYKQYVEQDELRYSQAIATYEKMNTDEYKMARTREIQSANAEIPLEKLRNEVSKLIDNIKDETAFANETMANFRQHQLAVKLFARQLGEKIIATESEKIRHKKAIAGEFNAEIKNGQLPQTYDQSVDFFSKTHAIVVANYHNLITTEELGTSKADLQKKITEAGVNAIKTAQREIVNGELYSKGKELPNKNTSDLNKWLIEEIDGMNNMSQVISSSIKQYGETVYPINEFYLFQQRLNKLKNQITSINSNNLENSENERQIQTAFIETFKKANINEPESNPTNLIEIKNREETETPKFIRAITTLLKRPPKIPQERAAA